VTDLPQQPRLFVAVELDGHARQALDRLQQELQSHGLHGLRWVRPEGIHLTLKFLGETPRETVVAITEALAGSTAGVGPHRLALGSLGTFGSRNAPRVLWVDLKGDLDDLLRLQEGVERVLTPLGFPRESRRFSPHLTLARLRPESAREAAGPLAQAIAAVSPPSATIDVRDVSLMLSRLGPGGAVYTRLEAFPLAA
jgi:2'-5' RNA ligase